MKTGYPLIMPCVLIACLAHSSLCYSQSASIEFLIDELRTSQGRKKADVLNLLGDHYLHDYPQKALEYFTEAAELARKTGHTMGQADALHKAGACKVRLGKYPEAKMYLLRAQKIFSDLGDPDKIAESYNSLSEYYTKNNALDSATACLQKALRVPGKKHKKADAQSYYLLGFNASYRGNYQEALNYFDSSMATGVKANDQLAQAIAHEGTGYVFRMKGKSDDALAAFEKALHLLAPLQQKARTASCYNGIGQTFGQKGDYDKAMQYELKSLKIYEELENKPGILLILNNLGGVNLFQENYNAAISYLQRALAIQQELGNRRPLAGLYSNLGLAYYSIKEYPTALDFYKRALVIAEELEVTESVAILHNSIALVHLKSGKYDSALLLFEKYLTLGEQMQDEGALADAYKNIGWLNIKTQQPARAVVYLQKAMELAAENETKELLKEIYSLLSDAYGDMKDYERSLTYHKLFTELKDSLHSREKNKVIADMEAKYGLEKKDKELAQNNVVLQQQKLSLARKQYSITALILVIVTLVVLGLFLRVRAKKQKLLLRFEYEEKNARIKQQLELARLKSDFFTNISHEFRTPLTLVLTPLQQMMDQTNDELLRQQYELMTRNANRLLTMVNEILALSKIESGHDILRAGRYNILNFIREILNSFSPLAENTKIGTVMVNELEDPVFFFDKDKLEKVFYNILANAFKHTPSGGTVIIYVRQNEADLNDFNPEASEGSVAISVKDSGKGIAAEHLPHLFTRFYQVADTAQDGSGIGLSLAKEIVELHCGTINVKSTPGEGTEFIVTLPRGKSHLSPEEIMNEDPAPGTPYEVSSMAPGQWPARDEHSLNSVPGAKTEKDAKVLVVEDHEDLLKYMHRLLSPHYHVITATNGDDGLEQVSEHHPELIVCDVMMPGMDGYDFTRTIKSNISTSHIPVIMLTAKADQAHKIAGLETGADDYISKPFDSNELLVRGRNLIEQRRKLRKLFSEITSNAPEASYNAVEQKFLDKATKIVTDHIDDPDFNVEKFCREIGMSHASLHNKLKALTDQSVTRFVRRVRLKKAAQLMEEGAGNMTDIALSVGFNNRQFFIRSFKEHFGMTPTEYKISVLKKVNS